MFTPLAASRAMKFFQEQSQIIQVTRTTNNVIRLHLLDLPSSSKPSQLFIHPFLFYNDSTKIVLDVAIRTNRTGIVCMGYIWYPSSGKFLYS